MPGDVGVGRGFPSPRLRVSRRVRPRGFCFSNNKTYLVLLHPHTGVMLPVDTLKRDYPDGHVCSEEDVRAMVTLAEGSLRPGSSIDVYCDGVFWEAEITSVSTFRFRYRFLHVGRYGRIGWVLRRHFMASWRFPVRALCDMWKVELIVKSVIHD